MIHFVTSCGKDYSRPWIFPTLAKLNVDGYVFALLQPGYDRQLPDNVIHVPFEGDRFYQDGLFLDSIDTLLAGGHNEDALNPLEDDDTLILADADGIIQRPFSEKDLGLLEGLDDAFMAGPNMDDLQTGDSERYGLGMKYPLEDTADRLGVSEDDLTKCQMRNWGLVAAKVSSWRKLRTLYRAMRGDSDPQDYFVSVAWMQYLLCVILHRNLIPVIDMPLSMHSHDHFGLRLEHGIEDRVLTYKGETVFFAHYISGVTHGRDRPRSAVSVMPHVVWHVACMGNWRAVATEQLALLRSVEIRQVDVSYVGNLLELNWLLEEAAYHGVTLNMVAKDADLKKAEIPALLHIEELAKKQGTDRPILYFHTKGVSRPDDKKRWTWRRALQEFTIKRWKENVQLLLSNNLDAVGFNWVEYGLPYHFSGNFWLASPDWIRKLPDFRQYSNLKLMPTNHRFPCESWIGSAKGIDKRSVGAENLIWEKTDFLHLINYVEHMTTKHYTFATSSAADFPKQWVWPTLHHLSSPIVAFLHPKDKTVLPEGVTRMPYLGDRFFYDGKFLLGAKDIRDDEVVVLFDVDGVFQRDALPEELDPPMDGIAAGWNSKVAETGRDELPRLKPKLDDRKLAGKLGLPESLLRSAPTYNLGLVSARASTWRYLAYLYNRHIWSQGPSLFGDVHFQQYLVCLLLEHYHIPVRPLGFETHSHNHYGMQREHNIDPVDGKLRYPHRAGKVVLFAHNILHLVKGVAK